MQKFPYSINFDESTVNNTTQLVVNVGHIGEDFLVRRKMFGSFKMEEGTSAEELSDKILDSFDKERVEPTMLMHPATDGCFTMLGVVNGAVAILRRKIPTIPKWGGCPGHDCSNILKSATKALDPSLCQIYPAVHAVLSKHSIAQET